ncbi:hypothetical protein PS1M3_03720 [Pseudoalteromonas sp. PS1M3]|uniref:hypothetical protein n=1 Tax=Pseudoalteromonas sp. PS1M3 TaxID=87791 RepID=UPI0019507334|nr:hypothetical protein [Pseudoalteromonas sp. PS1M3]BBW90285.1 hypothetical protein PS1M3_03720 [Pseudoalteromonas sp. PS1M3]
MLHSKFFIAIVLVTSLVLSACSDNEKVDNASTASKEESNTDKIEKIISNDSESSSEKELDTIEKTEKMVPSKNSAEIVKTYVSPAIVFAKSDDYQSDLPISSPKIDGASTRLRRTTITIDDKEHQYEKVTYGSETASYSAGVHTFMSRALKPGVNEFKIEKQLNDGTIEIADITVTSQATKEPYMHVVASQSVGYESLNVTYNVTTNLDVEQVFVDIDEDGKFEFEQTGSSFVHNYKKIGVYQPKVMVKLKSGLYVTSIREQVDVITVRPTPVLLHQGVLNNVIDIEEYNGDLFALSSAGLHEIDGSKPEDIIDIKLNGLRKAQGFGMDFNGNVYVANTGRNQIAIYTRESNYKSKTKFGKKGTDVGKFTSPLDVAIDSLGVTNEIYILEQSNKRVQVFSDDGHYLRSRIIFDNKNGADFEGTNIVNTPNFVVADLKRGTISQFNGTGTDKHGVELYKKLGVGRISYSDGNVFATEESSVRKIPLNRLSAYNIPIKGALQAISFGDGYIAIVDKKSNSLSIYHDPDIPLASNAESIVKQFVAAVISQDVKTLFMLSGSKSISARAFSRNIPQFSQDLQNNLSVEVTEYGMDALGILTFDVNGERRRVELDVVLENSRWLIR